MKRRKSLLTALAVLSVGVALVVSWNHVPDGYLHASEVYRTDLSNTRSLAEPSDPYQDPPPPGTMPLTEIRPWTAEESAERERQNADPGFALAGTRRPEPMAPEEPADHNAIYAPFEPISAELAPETLTFCLEHGMTEEQVAQDQGACLLLRWSPEALEDSTRFDNDWLSLTRTKMTCATYLVAPRRTHETCYRGPWQESMRVPTPEEAPQWWHDLALMDPGRISKEDYEARYDADGNDGRFPWLREGRTDYG